MVHAGTALVDQIHKVQLAMMDVTSKRVLVPKGGQCMSISIT